MDNDEMYGKTAAELRKKGLESEDVLSAAMWERRAQYLEVIYNLYHNNYPRAREKIEILLASSDPEHDPAMIAWPILKKGMICDLEGNRNEAKKYYEQVLQMENASGAPVCRRKISERTPETRLRCNRILESYNLEQDFPMKRKRPILLFILLLPFFFPMVA